MGYKNAIQSTRFLAFMFGSVLLLGGLVAWQGSLFAFLFLFSVLVYGLSFRLDIGWYILVVLSMMIHWEFRLDRFSYLFENSPLLLSLNAPAVDFWVLVMLCALMVFFLRQYLHGKTTPLKLPGIHLFLLFIISGALSLMSVSPVFFDRSLWYLVRFFGLMYFGYVLLAANIITTRHILRNTLIALSGVGAFAATMGLLSFPLGVGNAVYGVHRAAPFSFFGWAPFGFQHIFLAEVITAALPAAVVLWFTAKNKKKNIWLWLAVFLLTIGLLTLSRAGWISFAVGATLAFFLFRKQLHAYVSHHKIIASAAVFFFVLISGFFVHFLFTSAQVTGSTSARVLLAEVSLYLFEQHPLIGSGVGNYINEAAMIDLYRYDIGANVDAHGILQKVGAEQGLFGLLSLGLFFGYFLRRFSTRFFDRSFESTGQMYAALSVFLFVMPLTFQLFNTQYYSSVLWVPIGIAIAAHLVNTKKSVLSAAPDLLSPNRSRSLVHADVE